MAEETEQTKTWWVFFPVKGLDVLNKRHDLDKPLFGDATLVSKKHIRQIVHLLEANKRMGGDHDHERDIIYMMEHATLTEDFQSLIAVQRSGTISEEDRNPQIVRDSAARAYQIVALLALVFLARSHSGQACGLVEQLHRQTQSLAMLDLQGGGFRFRIGGGHWSYTILDPKKTIQMSRGDLKKVLYQKRFTGLTQAVLSQRPSLPKSLRKAIAQSTIRLSDAVHSITPSAQLLGAVTSIEILLTGQVDSYETTKRRLAALLGTEAIIQYDAESVLRARHLYVHRGEEPEGYAIPLTAIGLALSCLLRYAEAAPGFSSKTALIEYLDFVYRADSLSCDWSEMERRAFQQLLKHERKSHEFPFLVKQLVNEQK